MQMPTLTKKARKELRDQSAHAGAAIAVVMLAELLGADIGIASGLLIGFALGLVRELTEEGEISLEALKAALGSELDLAFWTAGGGAWPIACAIVGLLIG